MCSEYWLKQVASTCGYDVAEHILHGAEPGCGDELSVWHAFIVSYAFILQGLRGLVGHAAATARPAK